MNQNCKKCNERMIPKKFIWLDKRGDNTYRYSFYCQNCKINYYQPTTREMYELVKDLEWEKSKRWWAKKGSKFVKQEALL